MVEVFVAASLPATATIIAAVIGRKQLKNVSKQVATKNGKTTGEYVEMLDQKMSGLDLKMGVISKQFAEHTIQDEQHFAALEGRMDQLSKDVTE